MLLLILPAFLLMPLQRQILAERQQFRYGGATVTRQLRDQIGQGLAIALLAGFRGVAADFIWIRGQGYWENRQWFKQSECIENTVKLQPQSTFFWEMGSWHMAWNIAYAERVTTGRVTRAEGIIRERYWHERSRAFLERGTQNLPHRYDLYFRLGWLYNEKLIPDCASDPACETARYEEAIAILTKAASFPDVPPRVARYAAHCVEKAGDSRRAYEYWRTLWQREELRQKDFDRIQMQRDICRLEELLKIPDTNRICQRPTNRS